MRLFNRLIAIAGVGLMLMLITVGLACAESTNTVRVENSDGAWVELQQAAKRPQPPAEWKVQPPTGQQKKMYSQQVAGAATQAASKARVFYLRFPNSTNAIAARKLEFKMLNQAFSFTGDTNTLSALAAAQDNLLANPGLSDDDRFDLRVAIVSQRENSKRNATPGNSMDKWNAGQAEREKGIRELIKDYPNRDLPYQMLLYFGANASNYEARAIANEILTFPVSEKLKTDARGILRRLDAPGKPLDIKFTALDGREVDLSKMQGKVVLVDFWATWCGSCVGELPRVEAVYQEFHGRGFEVIGISFDQDKTTLQRFLQTKVLPWPQYFDGRRDNKFGVEYGIHSIPTMWLVDKKGDLRETNVRDDLRGNVEKLLAE